MAGKEPLDLLQDLLEEAELSHHQHALEAVLGVHSPAQLRHVSDEDLYHIGMSKPEAKRLKALSGGNKTNVSRSGLCGADARELPPLQQVQQLTLHSERQITDFVQEQRSPIGSFDLSDGLC